MIAFVKGTLDSVEEASVLVDCSGVGYRVFTPINEELLRVGVGNPVKFYTYLSVREDAQTLFGFLQRSTLDLFKQLINVNGVGPKFALGILSYLTEEEAVFAIASEDVKALSKVPGIGAKTAARIILDLKDKVSVGGGSPKEFAGTVVTARDNSVTSETVMALTALGYSQSEALAAVSKIITPEMTTEEALRLSLKQLF